MDWQEIDFPGLHPGYTCKNAVHLSGMNGIAFFAVVFVG
jgi:hypothetical protein